MRAVAADRGQQVVGHAGGAVGREGAEDRHRQHAAADLKDRAGELGEQALLGVEPAELLDLLADVHDVAEVVRDLAGVVAQDHGVIGDPQRGAVGPQHAIGRDCLQSRMMTTPDDRISAPIERVRSMAGQRARAREAPPSAAADGSWR